MLQTTAPILNKCGTTSSLREITSGECEDHNALLFFSRLEPEHLAFFRQLRMNRWSFFCVDDVDNATQALSDEKIRVGLILFNDDCDSFLAQVNNLVAAPSCTQWIALVHDKLIRLSEIRETIASYFYDYHRFPLDKAKLLAILGHASGMSELTSSVLKSYDTIIENDFDLLGDSDAMRSVRTQLAKFARFDKTVLITGETGTGKELAARALHCLSPRSTKPLIAVNTASLSPSLVQAELFGHEKGSFTGAHKTRIGKIEAANEGTIFLDEIGDVSLDVQVALLRFLQEKTIERLGSTDSAAMNVRVISATHRDLEEAVKKGSFREDLYYRINTLHLRMPPLRERGDDVIYLAYSQLNRCLSEQRKSKPKDFSFKALQAITRYSWPGNVRELFSRVERAVFLCDDSLISPRHLDLEEGSGTRRVATIEEARRKAEQEAISHAIRYTNGNLTHAAKVLGISRASLYRLQNNTDKSVED